MFTHRESISLPEETVAQVMRIGRQFVPLAPDATVVPVTGGFSGAKVWRIKDGSLSFALRRWPASGPEWDRLQGLHRLLKHVHRNGLEVVPVPIATPSNHTLICESARWWQMEPWMPGIADFHRDPNSDRLRAAISSLAGWHIAVRTFRLSDSERNWFDVRTGPPPGLCERLEKFQSWQMGTSEAVRNSLGQRDRGLAFHAELREMLALVQHLIQPVKIIVRSLTGHAAALLPCLRDVWHDHLLFSGDRLTGLIDPAACRTDHVAADLSRLLGSLLEDDRARWQVGLDFYQLLAPLTLHDWSLLHAYDQSNVVLSGITWLEWLLLSERIFPENNLVAQRLQTILRRLKHLADQS